ncbi:zinc metalloproteinase nas-15-like [Watersipora subatra]|uniref:zinc metalloproteinase nas-15-like n=1 Tax=Watersipora subatra TaxID=2589382 RepID=UPI00355B7FF6
MEAVSLALLLLVTSSAAQGQTIDEILGRADSTASARSSSPILVDGGRGRLIQLDIAEALSCRSSTGEVPVSPAERASSEPVEGSWSDATVRSSGNNPSCNTAGSGRQKRNIISPRLDWPLLTTIPYAIDRSQFTSSELVNIDAAFADYTQYTCIRFIERTTEVQFLDIIRDTGCWSYVGFVNFAAGQSLSLRSGCAGSKRIPIHELYHALGAWHQQSRPDRDTFVTILYDNIPDDREHNFNINTNSEQYNTDYSYRSVMHYGRSAFSIDGSDTIITADPAFQSIIGNAPTFSFVDLQALHRHFECDALNGCPQSNPCAPSQYRGSDCQCYCKNDHIDNNVPAVLCDADVCEFIGVACTCTESKCVPLRNTECNPSSGACECKEGYSEIGGECVMNSVCNTIGVPCQCSTNGGDQACLPANTECNAITNACECKEDYYESRPGQCRRTPRCRQIGTPCVCSRQGADACRRIRGSYCDPETDSCECFPYHSPPINRHCVAECDPVYITDGALVSPFTSTSTPAFTASLSDEPLPSDMFGIGPNGYALTASGVGEGDVALLTIRRLTRDRNLRNIELCINFNMKLTNAVVGIDYRFRGSQEWRTIEYNFLGNGNWGIPGSERISIERPRNFKLRIRATGHPDAAGAPWEAKIDPLIIRNCNCGTPA